MPEVVVVRVSVESQSEPKVVEESGSVDGTVERVVAFVTDKHRPGRMGGPGEGRGRGWSGAVGTELRGKGEPAHARLIRPAGS